MLGACAKTTDLAPRLQKGLGEASKKLTEAVTNEQLDQVKQELSTKIGNLGNTLATTKANLASEISSAKTAALAQANDFATQSIAAAKVGLESTLAKQTALDKLDEEIKALKQNQNNVKDTPEFKALEKQISDFKQQVEKDEKKTTKASDDITKHAKRIADLERDWNAASKAKLEEANKKGTLDNDTDFATKVNKAINNLGAEPRGISNL